MQRHRGHFERAAGGTLFLDEVTEMPMELQVKLLRVLETRNVLRVGGSTPVEVDVRVIAATNKVPAEAVSEGKLREDLYYRLSVFPIALPPLRDRDEDLELLTRRFLAQLAEEHGTPKHLNQEVLARFVLQSDSSFAATSTGPDRTHPATYVIASHETDASVAAQEAWASKADYVVRLPADHMMQLSHPQELVEVLARV